MSTNDEPEEVETPVETKPDLEAELREAKAETKPEVEEADKDTKPETVEAEAQADATLTTEEPDHDKEWYKKAYEESTKEGLRLKGELDKRVEAPPVTPVADDDNPTPEQMYLRSKIAEETQEAFKPYLENFPQLKDKTSYDEFVAESELLGRVFVEKNRRLPTPGELYKKTVASLGWTPDNADELGAALRAGAETTRTSSSTPAPAPKSGVTEDMISLNMKMYPNKSRAEIITELEPHIT